MSELEKLKLKYKILQTTYDAICLERVEIIGEELTKIEAQIDILEKKGHYGKEETEKAKYWLSALDVKSEFEASSKEIILSYIKQLEQENKTLRQCLIDSNIKDVNEHLYLGNLSKEA